MSMETGKTSHVDHYKPNSISIGKAQKEHITAKAIQLRKPVVTVIKDRRNCKSAEKTENN